ncbi:MAG: hypothetical protein KME13_17015 [Myxacorys californica WJT36-NPBG1]|jgi:hypothetical protein|nr:hypothetical protein [Myxacorys californica WJT36-NPBG1]
MDFEIIPYQQAGSIRFGMTRTEIRQLFSASPKELSNGTLEEQLAAGMFPIEDVELVDLFCEDGVRVAYDLQSPHCCVAVGFFEPANPVLQGQSLLKSKLSELRKWLESIDEACQVESDGIYSYKFGICLYAEDPEVLKNELPMEVTVFTQGYYDGLE